MAFLGLKLGLDLEMAHPRQNFQRVPPRDSQLLSVLSYVHDFEDYGFFGCTDELVYVVNVVTYTLKRFCNC